MVTRCNYPTIILSKILFELPFLVSFCNFITSTVFSTVSSCSSIEWIIQTTSLFETTSVISESLLLNAISSCNWNQNINKQSIEENNIHVITPMALMADRSLRIFLNITSHCSIVSPPAANDGWLQVSSSWCNRFKSSCSQSIRCRIFSLIFYKAW